MDELLKSAEKIRTGGEVLGQRANELLELAVQELKGTKYIKEMASLLRVSIAYGADHKIISTILKNRSAVESIIQVKQKHFIHHEYFRNRGRTVSVSILEYAIYKKASPWIIEQLLTVGGRDLISLSSRSLIQGAIFSYNEEDTISIINLLIKYGGRELVFVASSWRTPTRRSDKRDTPLHIAYELNSLACVQSLLDIGGKELT
ncbi:predicted protein [Chaetoceros tenuissimus]|uniref:Ankyrin repeat protein n=1 Tax=Chaetoceros tenuissimus TaxID=426638 RepID=A0AAD3CEN6_9STRA|nr:predicted protein [Chaetoceros tenuissimus]